MDHLSRQFSCTSIADFEELDRAAKARKAEKAAEAKARREAEAAANAVEEEVLGVGASGGVDRATVSILFRSTIYFGIIRTSNTRLTSTL